MARLDATAASTNVIEAYWNGTLVASVSTSSTSWQNASYNVTGTGGLDRLEFRESSASNNGVGSYLDNVRLTTTAHASVDEGATAGTVITALTTTDIDGGDSFTYSIVGGSSLFDISGSNLVVKTGATLDFETATFYDITIRSTDAAGASVDRTVRITLRDLEGLYQGQLPLRLKPEP